MEVAAKLKGARISAQKARLVADQVRGKGVEDALDLLTYSNNLDPVEAIRADGKIGGFDPGVGAVTGELRVRFDSTDLIDQATSGQNCDLDLLWQIDADKSLAIAIPRLFFQRPKLPVTGPNGIEQTFNFTAARQSNGDPMMTAVLTNSRASYA